MIGYGIRIAIPRAASSAGCSRWALTLNFFFYIMINASMVMGLIPVVGIPMPLISYGGTAMLTVMFGFGLLMSVHVHRQVKFPAPPAGSSDRTRLGAPFLDRPPPSAIRAAFRRPPRRCGRGA